MPWGWAIDGVELSLENGQSVHIRAKWYFAFFRMRGSEKQYTAYRNAVENELLHYHFVDKLEHVFKYKDKSWGSLNSVAQILQKPADKSTKNDFGDLICNVYEKLNKEVIDRKNYKYSYIQKPFLQDGQLKLFLIKKQGKPFLYALLKWTKGKSKPVIDLIIADNSIIEDETQDLITLKHSSELVNNNLVQVVNQQNFLYVHGQLFPLITKMVARGDKISYKFSVQSLQVQGDVLAHYRVRFTGEGGDFIKTIVSVAKKEILNTSAGSTNLFELNRLKIDLLEAEERRKYDLLDNRERTRLSNVSIRNQAEDLAWEQTNRVTMTGLKVGGLIAGTIGQAFVNPKGAALTAAGGVTAMIGEEIKTTRNLEIQERSLRQQEMAAAFQIEQSKNVLDFSHKVAEVREKNRIYELSNTFITATPNNANILEAAQNLDTGRADICILHRYPTGQLLEYLTDYHDKYGFDIILNKFQLNMKNLSDSDDVILQFSNVYDVSELDPKSKESISQNFINGVYLYQHNYQLNNVDYAQLKKEHDEKVASAIAKNKKDLQAKEKEKLDAIKAQARGVEEAKAEYRRMERNYNNYKKQYETITQEKEALEREYEECVKKLDNYGVHIEEEVEKMKKEHAAETEIQIQEKIEEGIRAKTQQLEEEKTRLIKDKERIEKEKKQIELQQAQVVTRLNQTLDELDECKKSSENVATLRATYNTLVDAHQVTTRELEECKKQLKQLEVTTDETLRTELEQCRNNMKVIMEKRRQLTNSREIYKTSINNLFRHLSELGSRNGYIRFWPGSKSDVKSLINSYIDIFGGTEQGDNKIFNNDMLQAVLQSRIHLIKFPFILDEHEEKFYKIPKNYYFNTDHSGYYTWKGFGIDFEDGEQWNFMDYLGPDAMRQRGRDIKQITDKLLTDLQAWKETVQKYCNESPFIFGFETSDECIKKVYNKIKDINY